MKFKNLLLRATTLMSLFGVIHPCFAQGTAFSYKGRLSDNGSAADGNYDLQFTIHDAPGGGGLVAGPLTNAVTSASPPIPGQIYTSSDSGLTWTVRENNRDWRSVATSADGTKLVAVVAGGNIYIFTVVTSTASGMNTTIGTGGFLIGGQAAAIELVYIGAGRFSPVSFVGAISAN